MYTENTNRYSRTDCIFMKSCLSIIKTIPADLVVVLLARDV